MQFKNKLTKIGALSALIASLSSFVVAPASAKTASAPPAPTNAFIQASPYMNLQLNLETQAAAQVGTILQAGTSVVGYMVTPRAGARTLAASAPRNSTYPQSIPAQTLLFEVGLEGLKGYCAPLLADAGERRTQCFIDVNADNKFDATYITRDPWRGKALYFGQVAFLASIPPVTYETASVETIAPEQLNFYFRRIRAGKAEFQMAFGARNNATPVQKCDIDGTSVCKLGQHEFVFAAEGGAIKVVSTTMKASQIELIVTP